MLLNKKNDINIDTTNNIQNNQRKENLRNLNQEIKINKNFLKRNFYKDLNTAKNVSYGIINILGLQKKTLNVNILYKRSMFTKGTGSGSIVLKKSGEIRINNNLNNDLIIKNPINSPRTNLNLMTNLNDSKINIIQLNNFAKYNMFDLNQKISREVLDCKNSLFTLREKVQYQREFLYNLYISGDIGEQYMLDYNKCAAGFNRCISGHNVVVDIIEETKYSITFAYYAITTSNKNVDFGAGNVLKTLSLGRNSVGKQLYFIPLCVEDTIEKDKYQDLFLIKSKEGYRESYQEQKLIVNKIIEYEKSRSDLFFRVHLKNDFLELNDIKLVNFATLFKPKNVAKFTTPWEEYPFNN